MLERPTSAHRPWPLWKTLVGGVLSAGVLPLVRWPASFDQRARAERFKLIAVADHVHVDADAAARTGGPRTTHQVVAYLAAGAMVALLGLTYWNGELRPMLTRPTLWGGAYLLASVVGYGALYLNLARHRRGVRRVLRVMGDDLHRPPGVAWPKWRFVLPAVIFGALGWFWAVPMFLVGGALRRWGLAEGRQALIEAARGSRHRLARRKELPPSTIGRRVCPNERCETELAPGAKFCPTCGTAATPHKPGDARVFATG